MSAQHCSVPGCNGDGRYHKELTFHSFPKDKNLRKQWIWKIRRDVGTLFKINNKKTTVCSRHFKKEDFKWSAGPQNGKRLLPGVIPTQFMWNLEAKAKRMNPMDKVRDAKASEFHESDISDSDCEMNAAQPPPPATIDTTESQQQTIEQLQREMEQMKIQYEGKIASLEQEKISLEKKIEIERFGTARFGSDDDMFKFYTGFVNHKIYYAFFNFVQPAARNMQRCYYVATEEVNYRLGRPSCMLLIDELFMFLCRLRLGLQEVDLADRFNCSVSTVSRKIITWCNLLYIVLGSWNIWISREKIDEKMPTSFKAKYSTTRVIIDCTEIKTQVPKSLVLNSMTYSSYKGANTFKGLIGIAPHGLVTFVSSLYTGCMSDVEITRLSGILELLEEGDSVMADKGFTIQKLLDAQKVSLNIPPFLHSNTQFTKAEVSETQSIAAVRIHVERAIQRIKSYLLFNCPIPLTLVGSINQLWTVAALLTNFKGPLINET